MENQACRGFISAASQISYSGSIIQTQNTAIALINIEVFAFISPGATILQCQLHISAIINHKVGSIKATGPGGLIIHQLHDGISSVAVAVQHYYIAHNLQGIFALAVQINITALIMDGIVLISNDFAAHNTYVGHSLFAVPGIGGVRGPGSICHGTYSNTISGLNIYQISDVNIGARGLNSMVDALYFGSAINLQAGGAIGAVHAAIIDNAV